MVETSGFLLNCLRVVGKNGQYSELKFSNGLNVISGASDTGKSYIFECLDFMMGSEKLPRNIEESKSYNSILLEVEDKKGNIYTLERSLKGGDFYLYKSSVDEIGSSMPIFLKSEHDRNDHNNISSFLLSLCGSPGGQLIKNKENDKVELSFRLISSFFLINEARIITEGSPIFANNVFTRTLEKSVFNYLITGKDDSSLISTVNPKFLSAQNSARIEVFDNLIAQMERKVKESGYEESEISNLLNQLSLKINLLIEKIDEIGKDIQEHQSIMKEAWDNQQRVETRFSTIESLLARFDLLKQHYRSDLDRLDFISEGDHYFSQLEFTNCPVCDSPLSDHAKTLMCDEKTNELLDIQTACTEEAKKIGLLMRDLESTITSLQEEKSGLQSELLSFTNIVERENEFLQARLSPALRSNKESLQEAVNERQRLTEFEIDKKRLLELWMMRSTMTVDNTARQKSIKKQQHQNKAQYDVAPRRELCNGIQQTLIAWKYISEGIVEFTEDLDIVINGKVRSSHGKGVRALLFSAFSYSLMKYCVVKNLFHPGILVIDSPLTTFREGEKREDGDEVSGYVQSAFFEDLAHITQGQVILMDNKEPPSSLKDRINFVQFTGKLGVGRKGFLI